MSNLESKPTTDSWITLEKACQLLKVTPKTVKNKCYLGELIYKVKVNAPSRKHEYFIKLDSLPQTAILKALGDYTCYEKTYSDAPMWSKILADKYYIPLRKSAALKGEALKKFLADWNEKQPEQHISYSSLLRMRNRLVEQGFNGLLAKYGNNYSRSVVSDDYFDYFKNLYLKEGGPSLKKTWDITLGYAMKSDNISKKEFPSVNAFKRRLENEIPAQSIYMARFGKTAWNRKYGNYLNRDYSNIICGKVWVSDHAQIDVACMTEDGKVVFPWVTAWRDYKSSKWLGWLLQTGSPNSDHIFQAFYYAAENYGLPEEIIIDNGKDYRCKDFAGGRKTIKIQSDEIKTTSMLGELNVDVNFALPYNAQTKPIERDFLKIKEMLSKTNVGYRGGNVVERPEILKEKIKNGEILDFNRFKNLFDDFIINVFNKCPSQGINLNGLTPNQLFNEEFKEKITTSRDALKLFCMRTSKTFTVGRNGIKDNEFKITYWADWLIAQTGLKVYLRRDIQDFKTAWVFKADNDEFVGKVTAVKAVAALHANEISKEAFKEALAIKKRNYKVAKAYIKQTREITPEEINENYKVAYASVEKELNPKVSIIANTNMDKAIRQSKEMEELGKYDLSAFIEETEPQDEPLYLFETDKILEDELKGVASGY